MAEVSTQPVADDWEQAEEALERLEITDADAGQNEEHADTKLVESATDSPSANNDISTSTSPKEEDGKVEEEEHAVDHALRDALSRHKHRNSVLRLEAEVEDFVLNSTEPSHSFSGEMSSYDRLLVHRTAQHWGLDTSTLTQGPDHGSILAIRTARTGPPQIKLTDLPVTMEEPVIPAQPVPKVVAADGATGATAPKVLVRRRGDRPRGNSSGHSPGNGGHGNHQRNGFNHHQHPSIEEKELNYERARARIFGNGGDQGMYPPQQHMMPHHQQMMMANHYHAMQMQQQQHHHGGNNNNNQGYTNNASGSPHPPQNQRQQHSNQHSGGNNSNANARNSNGTTTNAPKAQLRNRQEDLSDPDFRRGRRNTGPRFDPGFGEDMMMMNGQGMYVRPTYSSEFPSLGGGGPGGGGGGGGYMHHPHPYAAYGAQGNPNNGASAQGYPVHHPGQHMYAAAAGGGGGGNGTGGSGAPPAAQQMQMQYQQQQQQGYAMALGPYGYVPMRPGDGTGGMIPVMYMNNGTAGSPGGGPGGNIPVMYHPGSPPNAMGGMHMMSMSPSAMASPKSSSGGGGSGNWNQYHPQQQYQQHYHPQHGGGGGGNRQQQQQQQQQHMYQQQRGGGNQNRNQQRSSGGGTSGSKESTSVANTPRADSSSGSEKQKQSKKSEVEEDATSAQVE